MEIKPFLIKHQKNLAAFSVILAVFVINIYFGLPRLSRYSSVDEPYWTYDRTPDFWRAVSKQKWKDTDINDKPGITVAEISGIGLLSGIKPLEYKSFRQEPKKQQMAAEIVRINFNLRLPIYLTGLLILFLFYFFLERLLGRQIALISLIFIGLSPIILGISLIINPDSLLWGFLPLSILSYLVFQKDRRYKYLVFSGIFLGLSLLTKYVANILYVYLLGILFLEHVFSQNKEPDFLTYVKRALLNYGLIILVSLLTFFALYPNCWVNPKTLLKGTLLSAAFESSWPYFVGFMTLFIIDLLAFKSRLSSAVIDFLKQKRSYLLWIVGAFFLAGLVFVFVNTYFDMKFFDFEGEMASPKGVNVLTPGHIFKIVTTDIYGMAFGLTPLVLILFVWSILKNSFLKKGVDRESAVVFYFLIFILLYYFASTVNQVTATVRYQIVVYPLASIIAAIGASQLWRSERIKKMGKEYLIYPLLISFSGTSLLSVNPHFFNYSSSLLPRPYILNMKDMGDGSYEAAQYLNSLPDADQMVIWSDKGAVCETFLGQCKVSFNKNDTEGINFDYFVVSTGRKSRSLKLEKTADFTPSINFEKLYDPNFQDSKFQIIFNKNKNNFVRVAEKSDVLKRK